MAPKRSASVAKLSDIVPSPEELEEAQKTINALSEDELKKQKANMAYWLKSRSQSSTGVRGEERRAWLQQYLVMKSREKGASLGSKTEHKITSKKTKATTFKWMTKFAMEQAFGEGRTRSLIDCGKLETKPCETTGLDDADNRHYKVYEEIGGEVEDDTIGTSMAITEEGIKKGDDLLDTMDAASSCMSGKQVSAIVKEEPLDAAEVLKKKQLEFKKVVSWAHLRVNIGEIVFGT